MEEKVDIVALGELLIDFTEAGHSQGGRKLFEQNPGGAPANLLTVASHFGYRTSFIGKVGNDMHGKFLKRTLQTEGINTDAIVEDPDYFTTLAWRTKFFFCKKTGCRYTVKKRRTGSDINFRMQNFSFWIIIADRRAGRKCNDRSSKNGKSSGCTYFI